MKRILTTLTLILGIFAFGFSQGSVSGSVMDKEAKEPLIGASVIIEGTTKGTVTDFNGKFKIGNLNAGDYKVLVTYLGYSDMVAPVIVGSENVDLGNINLAPEGVGLTEVKVIASVAVDRRTPVAVSNIDAKEINAKLGNQEFTEIMKMTPSITASKDAGGFGDSRINVRGFAQENVALLINGIPVNGMEDNKIYWSNWAGLGDVTRTIQIQRGLGASRLAVASVGGTINILTNGTDQRKGGSVFSSIGNDGYRKFGLTLSTGKTEDGWAVTFSGSRTLGDGYIENTYIDAWSYFGSIAKEFGDKHLLMLSGVGAPQRHGQRDFPHSLRTQKFELGKKWNDDAGTYQGQQTSIRENFYHKPQVGLSHIWDISPKSTLSTSAYFSVGRGGGTGDLGGLVRDDGAYRANEFRQSRDADGHFQFDEVAKYNAGFENRLYGVSMSGSAYEDDNGRSGFGQIAANGINGLIKRASMNEHEWYGVLSNYSTELTDNLKLTGGIDLRWYHGSHYRKMVNLWGADFWFDDDNINQTGDWVDFNGDGVRDGNELGNLVRPKNDIAEKLFGTVSDDQKIDYHNDEDINWYGVFTELEYSKDALSAFISGGINYTTMRRYDYFQKRPGEDVTDWLNFLGGNVKGGINYNLTEQHNIFANAGLISRAPYFDALFPTFNNDEANEDALNEQVLAFELGYGFRSPRFRANLNGYYTSWSDKTEVANFNDLNNQTFFLNLLGVDAVHMGIEFDFAAKLHDRFSLTGFCCFWRLEVGE